MNEAVTHTCEGCGGRLVGTDDVRALYRERLDPLRPEDDDRPRWSYCHVGHEPAKYVITGRGRLIDLETQRRTG
jgi:hypothetical protein